MIDHHVFVDSGYLRKYCEHEQMPLADPRAMFEYYLMTLAEDKRKDMDTFRISCYDGAKDPADETVEDRAYWSAIEHLSFTDIGFGRLRRGRKMGQKGVDVLLATDMLSGAFRGAFKNAWLLSGDADFEPLVREVRRYGVMVGLISVEEGKDQASDDLVRAVDRRLHIPRDFMVENGQLNHPLRCDGQVFFQKGKTLSLKAR